MCNIRVIKGNKNALHVLKILRALFKFMSIYICVCVYYPKYKK